MWEDRVCKDILPRCVFLKENVVWGICEPNFVRRFELDLKSLKVQTTAIPYNVQHAIYFKPEKSQSCVAIIFETKFKSPYIFKDL